MLNENYLNKQKYEEDLISSIIDSVRKKNGENILSSIILTGSFGRNEPTYIVDDEGYLTLKSDVEIACVYKKNKKSTEKMIKKISEEFKEELNLMAISERRIKNAYNFNGSLVVPKYKTVFTFDLFNGSRTIWGEDFIGAKNIGIEYCDPYEAKRLVANRIGELVYLTRVCPQNEEYIRKQWKGKIILAIGSGFLIWKKKYVSSYHGQFNVIKQYKESICNAVGKMFFEDYEKTFVFLRESGPVFEVEDNQLRLYVRMVDNFFHKLELKNPKVNSVSRTVKYLIKYLKSGGKYGILHFEDNILQSLITQFGNNENEIINTAKTWHEVLY